MQNNDYLAGFAPVNADFDALFSNNNDSDTVTGLSLTIFLGKQGKVPYDQSDHKKLTIDENTQVETSSKVRTGSIDIEGLEDFKNMLYVDCYKHKVLDARALDTFFNGDGFNKIPRNELINLALIMLYFINNDEYRALASEAQSHFSALLNMKHISPNNDELKKALQKGHPTTRISGTLMIWYYVSKLAEKRQTAA